VSQQSLFERIGGAAAVDAAVDVFYRKVLADARISHFFTNVDMNRQRAKQKAFLTVAFGGPNGYTGKNMRSAHAHMKLTEEHFNAVMENIGGTLKELNVPDELIAEAAQIALSTKNDVLNL
jgi:hemoglobin